MAQVNIICEMFITRYLLFGILVFGWVNILQAKERAETLVIHAAQKEIWKLTLVDNSITVIASPGTVDSLRGGTFDEDDDFSLHMIQFFWKTAKKITAFKAILTFYNKKYESFYNALEYFDGLAQLQVPILANGKKNNPSFAEFRKQVKGINESKEGTTIRSGASFSWYKIIPRQAVYKYYRNLYYDETTKKSYNCSTTFVFPKAKLNFISHQQFEKTFGLFNKGPGKSVNNTPPQGKPLSKAKKGGKIRIIPV